MKIELTADQVEKIIKNHQANSATIPATYSIIGASRVLGISESTMHRRIYNGLRLCAGGTTCRIYKLITNHKNTNR
jgi:AraC-like DNA-binding protein